MEAKTRVKWYPVPGYEGIYEINYLGTVRKIERVVHTSKGERLVQKQYIGTRVNNCGYRDIRLSKNGFTKTHYIHILLAKIFIGRPESPMEVNHINGNKLDNRLENLEWLTHAQNVQHAYALGLMKRQLKPVIDTCSGKTFRSIKEAAQYIGLAYTTCKNYLNGNRPNPTCLSYAI